LGTAVSLACNCGTEQLAGGNSSETNNGVTISAVNQSISGTTVPNAHVSIYDQNYKPYLTPSGFCDSTVANDSGRFSFFPSQEGHYSLIVSDVPEGRTALIAGIPVFTDSEFADTFAILKRPGFIAGTAVDTAGNVYPLSYVYIDGSPFYTVTKNNGDFLLGPLPVGTYSIGIFDDSLIYQGPAQPGPAPLGGATTDSSVATVFEDSISTWHWK
jgi:hypothetical protein